ncbi:MAG: hypothetical protein JHC61_07530 [Burkholderiaceae bacterium]|nr:hypothetical protein [Burkholderiaceae bacterium]
MQSFTRMTRYGLVLAATLSTLTAQALAMPSPEPYFDDATEVGAEPVSQRWWEAHAHREAFVDALARIASPLEALEANPELAIAQSRDGRYPLYWLKRAMTVYPIDQGETFNLPIALAEEAARSLQVRGGKPPRSVLYPTRTYGERGDVAAINTGSMPAGVQCYASTGVSFHNRLREANRVPLVADAETTYRFSESGVLMLGCSHPDAQRYGEFVKVSVSGGLEHPLFILGQSDATDWWTQRFRQRVDFELFFNGQMLATKRIHWASDPTEKKLSSLAYMLRTAAVYERFDGMDSSEAIFMPSQGLQFENLQAFDEPASQWSLWTSMAHEAHVVLNDMSLFGQEASEAVYAIEVCRAFLGEVSLETCNPALSAYGVRNDNAVADFLNSNVHHAQYRDIAKAERMGFFVFLRSSYGPEFFAKISQDTLRMAHESSEQPLRPPRLRQWQDDTVLVYSRAAGHDLREYFRRWGLPFSEQASLRVEAMKLPRPG